MKKIMLLGLTVLMVLGLAVYGYAVNNSAPISSGGPHNMNAQSAVITGGANNLGGPCAYCHIPHNAGTNTPLSNRKGDGSTFCLSCHNGTTAINSSGSFIIQPPMGYPSGGNITDANFASSNFDNGETSAPDPSASKTSHAINVDYTTANSTTYGLNTYASALTGLGLTSTTGLGNDGTSKVTCQSCHAVHNSALNTKPFLRQDYSVDICSQCHSAL